MNRTAKNLIISVLLGLIATALSLFIFRGNCSKYYILTRDIYPSWYENYQCNKFDSGEYVYGFPFAIYSHEMVLIDCPGCDYPINKQVHYLNIFLNLSIYSGAFYPVIYLLKRKIEKQ